VFVTVCYRGFTLDSRKPEENQCIRFLPTKEAVAGNAWIG
jgi:hypothetical protein